MILCLLKRKLNVCHKNTINFAYRKYTKIPENIIRNHTIMTSTLNVTFLSDMKYIYFKLLKRLAS